MSAELSNYTEHPCACFLNEVFVILEQELEAINSENIDELEDLTVLRQEMLSFALNNQEGFDRQELKSKLELIQKKHEELIIKASNLLEVLRSQISASKNNGYVSQAKYNVNSNSKSVFVAVRS